MKRILAVCILVTLFATVTSAQSAPPLVVVSEIEPSGEFSVSIIFSRTSETCFEVPTGHYSQAWTFVAAGSDEAVGRGILNVYRQYPNPVPPNQALRGLQIVQRFELIRPTSGGDMWRMTPTSFLGPTVLCAAAASIPSTMATVWQAKLVGKAF